MPNYPVLVIVNGLVQQQPVGDTLITANSLDLGNQSLVATEGDMLLGTSNDGTVLGAAHTTNNSSNYFIASGGSANVQNSRFGFLGGWGPTVTADCAAVGGGNSNDGLTGCSVVCGGKTNTANGPVATILGGLSNISSGNNSIVRGGESNNATGLCSAALGGRESFSSGNYASTIGNNCYMETDYSQCWGGSYQSTSNTNNHATLAGGYEGVVSGHRATKLGGAGGTLNSACGVMLGGYQYTSNMSQLSTSSGGQNHDLAGLTNSFLGGLECVAPSSSFGYSTMVGKTANNMGMHSALCQATGKIATAGDAQFLSFTGYKRTTNNTAQAMTVDGSNVFDQPPNTLWVIEIVVIGIQEDGTRGMSYRLRGTTRRDGTANPVFCTAVAANPDLLVCAENATATTATLNISGNTVRVLVTGIASTNFRWVAHWNIAQVGVY